MQRREFIITMGGIGISSLFLSCSNPKSSTADSTNFFMPDESERHSRTWMAFGASKLIWGDELLPVVQQNLALIATIISKYEPVSMLVRESEYDLAKRLIGSASVNLITSPLDDLWIRDTGPVFVTDSTGKKLGIDFNFNGWGQKQEFTQDAKVASFVAKQSQVEVVKTNLVLEGGCIEVDGKGSAIITESCVLNDNRNPGIGKAEFEKEIKRLLGLKKIIWLPGIVGRDITDGHTDFYARFAGPGVVIVGYDPDPESFDHKVTKEHIEILKSATDSEGQNLEVLILEAPTNIRENYLSDDFAAGYIGYYLCNGAVLLQQFGDGRTDSLAAETLSKAFPNRKIEQLNIDGIAAGGGSIHCATQQEPAV